MAIEVLGLGADDVVKILTATFSGFAFLLSLLAFLMFKQEPQVASANALTAYRVRVGAMKHYLYFTLGIMMITFVAQYFLDADLWSGFWLYLYSVSE